MYITIVYGGRGWVGLGVGGNPALRESARGSGACDWPRLAMDSLRSGGALYMSSLYMGQIAQKCPNTCVGGRGRLFLHPWRFGRKSPPKMLPIFFHP